MWFLVYMLLMNSLLNQRTIQNEYRLSVGFAQIGIIEITYGFGLIYALIGGGRILQRYPSGRTHPAFAFAMVLLMVGFAMGLIGAIFNGAQLPLVVRNAREYLSLPISLIIGYRLLPNPRAAWKLNYVIALGGVLTATMLFNVFFTGAEKIQQGGNWGLVRTVSFCTFHAGIASILLFYSLVNPVARIMPVLLTCIVGGYCLLGQFAPMHRSDWVSITAAYLLALALLPREKIGGTLFRLAITVPIAVLTLAFGVKLGDMATGRDYAEQVMIKIESLLPTERKGTEAKAWDTRTGSAKQEFAIWLKNPVFGEGFSVQGALIEKGDMNNTQAYFHNALSSVLATTGIFGFAGWALLLGSLLVVGSRMVKNPVDRSSVTLGLMGYCTGAFLIVQALSTMIWTPRTMLLCGTVAGMMFRARDWEAHTLALQASEQAQDETWLYENGYYDANGGWLTPGQI